MAKSVDRVTGVPSNVSPDEAFTVTIEFTVTSSGSISVDIAPSSLSIMPGTVKAPKGKSSVTQDFKVKRRGSQTTNALIEFKLDNHRTVLTTVE